MSDRTEIFDVTAPPRLEVRTVSGDVVLREWDEMRVKVDLSGNADAVAATEIDALDDLVTIRTRSTRKTRWMFARTIDIVITMPPDGSLRLASGAGDVFVRVPMAEIDVENGAGDVKIERGAGRLRLKTGAGDIGVDDVADGVIMSASGDVRVRAARDLSVTTASGDVSMGSVTGDLDVKSASGDVRVRDFGGQRIDVRTLSGDTVLGLAPGRTVKASVRTKSGDLRNEITPSGGERTGSMQLTVVTMSGDVTLRKPF